MYIPMTEHRNPEEELRWCLFYNDQLLIVKGEGEAYRLPTETETIHFVPASAGQPVHTVTLPDGRQVKACALAEPVPATERHLMTGLRASYEYLPLADYLAAGKAAQILYWDTHSRYCPVCGSRTEQQTDIMKKCPRCGHELYPPIATAIIVLVRKGDEILLVHARNFRGTFHGLVAGFLEAGETLEQCVEREVMEETGLRIKNIRYFQSQPWPYPSGLMVGFMADYESGTIKLQDEELTAGAFYRRDNLPEIPRKLSIARKLIDAWLENRLDCEPEQHP